MALPIDRCAKADTWMVPQGLGLLVIGNVFGLSCRSVYTKTKDETRDETTPKMDLHVIMSLQRCLIHVLKLKAMLTLP